MTHAIAKHLAVEAVAELADDARTHRAFRGVPEYAARYVLCRAIRSGVVRCYQGRGLAQAAHRIAAAMGGAA